MIEVYKNDVISSDSFTDLAGNTVYRANYGERRLGLDFISGINEADEDDLLSTAIVCDICGKPVKKSEDELTEQNGYMVCDECIDED